MAILNSLPPFAIFYIGGLIAVLTRGHLRSIILVIVPVLGAWNLMGFEPGSHMHTQLLGFDLTLMRVDKLSLLFGCLFHLAAFIGLIFAFHLRDPVQQAASILYAGSALGAVFAGDLITLFIFWELLALTSAFLIWARRTERAYRATVRYLLIQVSSGLILLAGVLIHIQQTGSTTFEYIGLGGTASWLIFIAFGIKCAFPLLHNWLTDAYPESTPTGSVFLSAFTTKVAVYALARAYPGAEPLIYIGATMTAFPIFFAVIENDLRRVLGYSMINQIGFMVCGIGLGTELALNGAVSHAFNDVIFKGLLFMSMGAVLLRAGTMDGSHLGGLYKSMPITTTLCIVGAASISAFPLFSGFVSKSMVMAAAVEEGHPWVWAILLFASAGVFHHAGIKIPFFAFFAHDSGIRCKEAPPNMLIAMVIAAAICIFNGCYPWVLYSMLPFDVDYVPYTASHVLSQLQLLFWSAMAFTILKLTNLYPPELPSINIDVEWVYRRGGPIAVNWALAVGGRIDRAFRVGVLRRIDRLIATIMHFHGPTGVMARTWEIGNSVMVITLVLALFLVLFYA